MNADKVTDAAVSKTSCQGVVEFTYLHISSISSVKQYNVLHCEPNLNEGSGAIL
jgi:hypothetical protein